MAALPTARVIGIVYVLYFLVGIGAGILGRGNLTAVATGRSSAAATAAWLASTVVYAVLVVLLARFAWKVDARVAVAAAAFGILGCLVQFGAPLLRTGREGPVAALFLFGIFMVLYGWLLTRSPAVPTVLGVMFIIAGLGWCTGPIPGLPRAAALGLQGFGAIAEGALAVWLLVRG